MTMDHGRQAILQDKERALDWLTALSPVVLMSIFYYRWAAVLLSLLAMAGYLAVAALLQWGNLWRGRVAPAAVSGVLMVQRSNG